jgi:hypothetical protein
LNVWVLNQHIRRKKRDREMTARLERRMIEDKAVLDRLAAGEREGP